MGSIIIGLIITAGGFFLVWKTNWIVENFGHIAWAEEHLGSDGGTRLFYKFLGIIIILLGFATITGLFQGWLLDFASPFFGGLR